MDLETENKIAAILMKEAAELRRQAEKEGVLAYLRQPNTRSRPNSRFLTATVLGVQQANRAVEVNEMWRVRQKELELDKRLKGASRDTSSSGRCHKDGHESRNTERQPIVGDGSGASASCPSRRAHESCPDGLRDEELEEFLNSRVKRGRGAVGPRMDETGPYLPPLPDGEAGEAMASSDVRERRVLYGPEKPSFLKSTESSEDELCEKGRKKAKKSHSRSSDKEHSKKHKPKYDSKHKQKKRKEKKSKERH